MSSKSIPAVAAVLTIIALAAFVAWTPVPGALAAERGAQAAFDPADPAAFMVAGEDKDAKKGKYLFKKTCKKCHTDDAEGGEVTPISYIMEEWEEYFDADVHHGEESLSGAFDGKHLKIIRKFLIKYAADSEQPMTCG